MTLNWRKPIVFGLLKVTGTAVVDELKFIRSLEDKTPDAIRAVQNDRLAKLLRHAWEHTDYYREALSECGVVRNGQVDLDKFDNIPFLTKDIIRSQGPRLRAKVLPKGRTPYVNRSGGSTGEPVEFWQDNYYWDVNVASKLYHFLLFGKQVGELEMKIWGSDRDIFMDTSSWQAKVKNILYNRRVYPCSNLSDEDMRAIVNAINRFHPKCIWGYIDGVYTIARYINRHGLKLHAPAAVFGGGGTMLPHMEAAIQQAFRAPVVNSYGSREMGDVACECPDKSGLHISSYSHRIEVIDRSGNRVLEQEGDFAVTSLCNYAMPFIRYRIGDRGKMTARECSCGRGFPLLETVSGRSMESFITADGTIISPIYLITTIGTSFHPGFVKKLQIVQDDYSHVTLKLVLVSGVSQEDLKANLDVISAKVRAVMGQDCVVSSEFVDAISPTSSGKYLYTVCHVPMHGYSVREQD